MNNAITSGSVEVDIDGQTLALQPTLEAITNVSRMFGGLSEAVRRCAMLDFEAILFVLTQGLGLDERTARGFDEKVYNAGVQTLSAPAIRYLNILSNGGKPVREKTKAGEKKAAA